MSTILEAQRELERRGSGYPPQVPRRDTEVPWKLIALGCIALAAATGGLVWMYSARSGPAEIASLPADNPAPVAPVSKVEPGSEGPARPIDKPQAAIQSKPANVAAKHSEVSEVPPSARVRAAEPPVAAAVGLPAAMPLATPRPQRHKPAAAVVHQKTMPAALPMAPPEQAAVPQAALAPAVQAPVPQAPVPQAPVPQAPVRQAPVPQARASRAPAAAPVAVDQGAVNATNEPSVDVKSIAFGNGPRMVTLQINGGKPVTLREGQSASGIEVQLILPETVYLRHGANIFSVGRPLTRH